MISICDNCNYNLDYIKNLQEDVSKELASTVNKYITLTKYDVKADLDMIKVFKLSVYTDILEQVKFCAPCFSEYTPSELTTIIKDAINER